MSLLNEKIILTFSLDEEEINILNDHFGKVGVKPAIIINEDMDNCTLKEILEGTFQKDSKEKLPLEKAIIFNNFEGETLHSAVSDVRAILKSRPILATVTPISMNMKLKELIEHLIEEREFHKGSKGK